MNKRGRFAGFELVHLLLLVTAAELAFNRLATRELRPHGEVTPPWWHQALDHLGLFCQYFASTLAIGAVGYHLWRLLRRRDLYWSVPRWGLVLAGLPFLGLVVISLLTAPGARVSFWLETSFVAMVVFLVLGQLQRGGDIGAKIGLLFLATPMFVHYYGPLSMQMLAGEQARWSDLPERVQLYGQWTMVVAALASPYCFAPRPFMRSATRLPPLVVAAFVGIVGAVILRQHYEVGMRLAHHGLGVELGPGAPSRFLALYLLALGTITWTLTSCLTADSVSRRDIGVGLGLLVVGGYGFAWPLQYLVGLVGLITIGEATRKVAGEEREDSGRAHAFHAPPIADAVWQQYVQGVAEALRESSSPPAESPASEEESSEEEPSEGGSPVTIRGEDGHSVTHLVTWRQGVRVALRVGRRDDAIVAVEVSCGSEPDSHDNPDWTLYARPEKLLGVGSHPEPPATSAPVRKIDDEPFEQRFRVRDAGGHTEALFDEGTRARAIALIDGWIAYWSGRGLRYRVHPGCGAPLDHPIPITELAFRGSRTALSVERLVTLLDLLASMTSRALSASESSGDQGSPG